MLCRRGQGQQQLRLFVVRPRGPFHHLSLVQPFGLLPPHAMLHPCVLVMFFAGNGSYFDMAGPELSLDEGLLAYGVDAAGGEVYTL